MRVMQLRKPLPSSSKTLTRALLVFVLVDGWHLVCESVVTSFLVS